MRQFPASRFIADVGPKKQGETAAAPRQERDGPEPLQLFAVHDKNTPRHRAAEAHARGMAEGRDAAEAEWRAKLAELQELHEQRVSVERSNWSECESDRLAEQLTTGLKQLETAIGDTVAELLRPFLINAMQQYAVADLRKAIETVLVKNEGLALEVSGPEDLLQLLREKLSGKNIALLFMPGGGPEVRIVAGQTVMETQLQAWVAKIEESLR